MLSVYTRQAGRIYNQMESADSKTLADGVWIDMVEPSKEEEHAVEAVLGIEVPTPEEMRGLESSNQIYREGDSTFMTIRVVSGVATQSPRIVAVTFILTAARLVTLRYGQPSPFRVFAERLPEQPELLSSPQSAMVGLLEAIVERAADILEKVGDQLDTVSESLFSGNSRAAQGVVSRDLGHVLQEIGRSGELLSRTRESLHSIDRVGPTLRSKRVAPPTQELGERLRILRRDVTSLLDHATYVTTKIQFLLDSNLGLISIQQNAIIKILSVAALIFLPPTLIASIYGMNFEYMPGLKWTYGFPMALDLMLVSSVLPYWYFKKRRWL